MAKDPCWTPPQSRSPLPCLPPVLASTLSTPHLPTLTLTSQTRVRLWLRGRGPGGLQDPDTSGSWGQKDQDLMGGQNWPEGRTVKGSSISQLNAARLLPTLSPTPCHLHAPCLIYPGDPASLDPWEQVSTYPLMAEGFLGTNPQQRFKSLNSSFLVLILLQKMSPLQYAFSSERLTRHSYTVALHSEKPRI